MGERANVKVIQSDGNSVCLYTHWDGYFLAETVRQALAREQRWNDSPYLTRIIFCEMLRRGEKGIVNEKAQLKILEDETGYGISTEIGDMNYETIVVDTVKLEVHIGDTIMPFSYFIRLSAEEVTKLHLGGDDE